MENAFVYFQCLYLCRNAIVELIKDDTSYMILLILFLIKLNTSVCLSVFMIFTLFRLLNFTQI